MSSGRIPTATIARMLARPGAQSPAAVILPAVSFAVTTALVLTVTGGTIAFLADPELSVYAIFAVFAASLLVPPLATLGGSAARLSTRRRDDRLATLRLLGASTRAVTGIAVLETAAVATIGAAAGAALYAATMPLVGLLPFGGEPLGAARLWVGPWVLLGVVAGMVLVAIGSSLVALRSVRLTPLGVRTRASAPRIPVALLVLGLLGAIVVVGFAGVLGGAGPAFGMVAFIAAVCIAFAVAILLLNLIGTPIVAVIGRRMATRAKRPATLVAGRRLAEDARAAWRAVSAVSMTSFIAVVAGSGLALLSMADAEAGTGDAVFAADVTTGVLVTLAISFIALACTVGVTQAASVVDQRDLIRALDATGMPMRTLERARTLTVLVPLAIAIGGGTLLAILVAFPFIGLAIIVAPLSLATVAACFAVGVGCVLLAIAASRPIVTAIRRGPLVA
jgi:hypothetical protein